MRWNETLQNLCDKKIENINCEPYTRVLLGSYTCFNYFMYFIKNQIDLSGIRYDIVIPTFPQRAMDFLSNPKFIGVLNHAETIVVNDYGMLDYVYTQCKQRNIRLGRCFVKDYRDFRYPEYDKSYHKGYIKTQLEFLKKHDYQIESFETDIITSDYDLSDLSQYNIYFHYPFRLVSMSHICEFASIDKRIEEKFKPDAPCTLQCMNCSYCSNGLYKFGRGVYNLLSEDYLSQFEDTTNGKLNIIITSR